MNTLFFFLLLSVHIILVTLACLLLQKGMLRVPRAYIFVVGWVPFIGIAALIATELALRRPAAYVERDYTDAGQYISTSIHEDGGCDVVPLEEALLISDVRTRRALMMDMLLSQPLNHIEQLKAACQNDDMEVSHYATTTIMEIQRGFDLVIQRLDRMLAQHRWDDQTLDGVLEQMAMYLKSGLLNGYSLQKIRQRYDHLLALKARRRPMDGQIKMEWIRNKIELKEYARAKDELGLLLKQWPNDEAVWLLALRLAVEKHDRQMLRSHLEQMKQACVHWSAQGKQALQFWLGTAQ